MLSWFDITIFIMKINWNNIVSQNIVILMGVLYFTFFFKKKVVLYRYKYTSVTCVYLEKLYNGMYIVSTSHNNRQIHNANTLQISYKYYNVTQTFKIVVLTIA